MVEKRGIGSRSPAVIMDMVSRLLQSPTSHCSHMQESVEDGVMLTHCWYQVGGLTCSASRLLWSAVTAAVLVIVGICASISVKMMWDAAVAWWSGPSISSSSVASSDSDGDFQRWLASPTVRHSRLNRSSHLHPLGLLNAVVDGGGEGSEDHYAVLDLPPPYEAVGDPPSYATAIGLDRVLPGHDQERHTWV